MAPTAIRNGFSNQSFIGSSASRGTSSWQWRERNKFGLEHSFPNYESSKSARCSSAASRCSSNRRADSIPESSASPGTSNGSPMTSADGRERFGDLRAVPALHAPVPIRLEMERQHRIAGRLGEPERTWLGDPGRPARSIHGEPGRFAGRHVALQLQEGLRSATRGRSAGRSIAKPPDDARNPLAVEVLARDDDDAAAV